ncbi:alginate O-acetyltransferase AlgX-related protein (plasmid) [Ralstonia sp. 25C]|uniref:alginate O-acetyltransferase AlgX-related protein n=1 Tax=Ralstonia sp. 25C TaxID=3447363 RepID=UPI003F753E51
MTDLLRSPSGALSQPIDARRRRVLFSLGAAPLAGALAALPTSTWAAQGATAPAGKAQTIIEGRDRWLFPGWESLAEDDTVGCQRVLDLIHRAADKLSASDIRTVVVIAPLKARAYADKLPDGMTLSPAVKERYAALMAHGGNIGLDMVDAEAAIATIATVNPTDDTTFIRADYHWSGRAAEAVAAATAKRLQAHGLFVERTGGGTRLGKWTEEISYGDLAELLPPEKKKAVGKDHFFVRQAGASKDLLDDAPPLLHVVGNSMVQPYLGFPQKLSNAIDQPVGLTWTFGNVGPWKTLLNYVESPAFKSGKIKALVWQFNEGQMMNGPNAATQWDTASIMAEDAWLARLDKALAR